VIRKFILVIVFISLLQSVVYSAADVGITDRIWQDRSRGLLDLNLLAIDIDNTGRRILCASETRVYLSEDAGRSWRFVLQPKPDHHWDVTQITTVRVDDIEIEPEEEDEEFDRNQYDIDELFERGVLEFGEDIDSLSDEELQDRLESAGLWETTEPDDFPELYDEDEEEESAAVDITEDTDDVVTVSVHGIEWDPVYPRFAYVATSRGLYRSSDFGNTWRLTPIRGFDDYEDVFDLAVIPPNGTIVAAMHEGLYVSYDRAVSFAELANSPSGQFYTTIKNDVHRNNALIALSDHHVYIGRIDDDLQTGFFEDIPKPGNSHSVEITRRGQVYVAENAALYRLTELNIWETVPAAELYTAVIREITSSEGRIFSATNRGVFIWHIAMGSGRFFNLGLMDFNVRDISVNPANPSEIWIASASGVFVLALADPTPDVLPRHFLPEGFPALEDLIKSSLHTAQINTQRDRRWFDRAQRSVLYPRVEFTWDYAAGDRERFTRSSLVTITGGEVYTGPFRDRHTLPDRERFRIQLRLNWSPNRAIFNRDEFGIQQRLRNEVIRRNSNMNEVRRLYTRLAELYEEKQAIMDVEGQIDYVLRIQQTRAQLDALTGHSFEILSNY
jgi:hypothetical protein